MKVLESKPIEFTQAKEILNKREENRELGYEQKITLDYLRNITYLTKEDVEKIIKSLESIDELKPHQIMMIVNMMPEDKDAVNALFMKERINLDDAQIKTILDTTAQYRQERKTHRHIAKPVNEEEIPESEEGKSE